MTACGRLADLFMVTHLEQGFSNPEYTSRAMCGWPGVRLLCFQGEVGGGDVTRDSRISSGGGKTILNPQSAGLKEGYNVRPANGFGGGYRQPVLEREDFGYVGEDLRDSGC